MVIGKIDWIDDKVSQLPYNMTHLLQPGCDLLPPWTQKSMSPEATLVPIWPAFVWIISTNLENQKVKGRIEKIPSVSVFTLRHLCLKLDSQ